MPHRKLLTICILATLVLFVGAAWAQNTYTPPPDTLKVDYFANANTPSAPDGTVRIINPGTSGGNLCADIYVFDANEEMSECCSCTVTPDGLLTLSVNTDLTGNPLTGVTLNTGVIKVVSAATRGGGCPIPTSISPTATLRDWVTHIQNSNFTVTESESADATLSTAEQAGLQLQCSSIKKVGSGKGICANSAAWAGICND